MFHFQELCYAFEFCTLQCLNNSYIRAGVTIMLNTMVVGNGCQGKIIKMQVHQKRGKIASCWVLDSTIRLNRRVYVRWE